MFEKLIKKIKRFFYPSVDEIPEVCQKVVIDSEKELLTNKQEKAAQDYVAKSESISPVVKKKKRYKKKTDATK